MSNACPKPLKTVLAQIGSNVFLLSCKAANHTLNHYLIYTSRIKHKMQANMLAGKPIIRKTEF